MRPAAGPGADAAPPPGSLQLREALRNTHNRHVPSTFTQHLQPGHTHTSAGPNAALSVGFTLLLLLSSGWSQLWTALRSHGRIQLPHVGGHVVRLLVGRVWGRVGSLWSSLRVCHCAGWRLQSCVPSHLRGYGQACAGGPALLRRGCRGSQNPHGRHG